MLWPSTATRACHERRKRAVLGPRIGHAATNATNPRQALTKRKAAHRTAFVAALTIGGDA
jgi:hypothetical protein